MSVKDLIWVNVAQGLKFKREFEIKSKDIEHQFKIAEALHLALCDIREVSRDTNLFVRMLAAAKTGQKRIEGFDPKDLPSVRVETERKEKEELAKMTPEQIRQKQKADLLAGKTVVI